MIFNSVVIVLSLVSFVCLCFFVSERRKIQSEKNYCSLSFPLAILCSQFVELRLQFQADPLPLKALSAWHIQTHEQRQTLKMNLSSTHSEMCIFAHTVSVHCTVYTVHTKHYFSRCTLSLIITNQQTYKCMCNIASIKKDETLRVNMFSALIHLHTVYKQHTSVIHTYLFLTCTVKSLWLKYNSISFLSC